MAVVLVFAVYSNHFHNAFHFDDSHVIQNNLHIRSLDNIPNFFVDANTFSSLPSNATYRPLLSTTYAFDYWVAGELDPWYFHVTQFLLLILLGIGLTGMFRFIMDRTVVHWWNTYVALFAAVLFCVHTANTETVNYLSSRSSLLATLGVVGAFLLYTYFPRWRRSHVYLAPMMLGVLVKPLAVMFAPLLLVYGLLFEKRLSCEELWGRNVWPKIRHALSRAMPALLTGIGLFVFVESMNPPGQTYASTNRLEYLLTQPFIWLHYARLFFLPLGLTADTDWTLVPHWYDTRVIIGLVFIVFLFAIVWRSSRTRELRPVTFGILWFMLGLLPTSSIFPLSEVANEHRIFFPFVGLSLAVTWWMALAIHRWNTVGTRWKPLVIPVTIMLIVLVLGSHGIGTYQRNQVWATEEILWKDVVEKSPNNARALMNYGLSQMSKGRYEQAKELFDQAKTIWPHYAHLETNLGIVTARIGSPQEAEQHFRRAIQLRKDFVGGHYFFARWLVDQGRASEAIPRLRQALQVSQSYPAARKLLMNLYAAKGDQKELQNIAKETLRMFPDDTEAAAYADGRIPGIDSSVSAHDMHERGMAQMNNGHPLKAALSFRHVLTVEPGRTETGMALARMLVSLGFKQAAVQAWEQFAQASEQDSSRDTFRAQGPAEYRLPTHERVRHLFAEAYAFQREGDREQAIQGYEKILLLDPHHKQVTFNLAYAYLEGMTSTEWKRSAELFHKVFDLDHDYVESLHHVASAYWKFGKKAQAEKYDQAYLEHGPQSDLRDESE